MLSFIGVGNAFNYRDGNCSAFYKKDGKMLLLDCGEDVFDRIVVNKLLDDIDVLDVLITHFHSDHVGSLGTLIFYSDMINIQNINIIYPNLPKLDELLEIYGVKECRYKISLPEDIDDFNIQHIKQKHDIIDAYGYLFNIEGKKVYYSGDTRVITDEILDRLLSNRIDYFYQDTAMAKNNYHISLEELKELIPVEYRDKVYCMHLHTQQNLNEIKNSGFCLAKRYRKGGYYGDTKSCE